MEIAGARRMTKDILEQYTDLQAEAKDLRKRIKKTEEQLRSLEKGGTVIDSVKGTRRDGTFGSIRIEGFPRAEYDAKCNKLYLYKLQLMNTEEEVQTMVDDIRAFIGSIKNSRMRQIIRYRVEDGLSWEEVAEKIGEKLTGESCRKQYERFFSKKF